MRFFYFYFCEVGRDKSSLKIYQFYDYERCLKYAKQWPYHRVFSGYIPEDDSLFGCNTEKLQGISFMQLLFRGFLEKEPEQ